MRFCLLFGLACAAFQLASTLPVPNPIYDHDLDIRNTDFEVFEARAKDNPRFVKVVEGPKRVFSDMGESIAVTVKTGIPSQSVKKPDGQAVVIRNISKTHR